MHLELFAQELKKVPMTGGFVQQIDILKERYGDEYVAVAENILQLFEVLGLDVVKTSRKYIFDYLKELDYFIKNQRYGHDDFDAIREKIYDNESTMLQTYMPGLLLSYAYTTILYEKNHVFLTEFLSRLSAGMKGIEVGFGEGFYMLETLQQCPDVEMSGYDISPFAIEFAAEVLKAGNISQNRYTLSYGNVFEGIDCADASMDFAVLAEVIEHIPNPSKGIEEVVRTLHPGGILYLTTVIDSNHMDHISNFESPAVVEALLKAANLEILSKKIYHMTDDFPESKDKSIGLAYVAEKM